MIRYDARTTSILYLGDVWMGFAGGAGAAWLAQWLIALIVGDELDWFAKVCCVAAALIVAIIFKRRGMIQVPRGRST